jgi:D-alanine-D-alanine ligase
MGFRKVGVLLGGMSAEREVSLAGGRAVANGLRRAGFEVVEIDVSKDLDRDLRAADVEAVYIVLHGRLGEDGTVQGMLEMMGIPYTGSSVTASAVAMNKVLTRNLLAAGGVRVAEGAVLSSGERKLPRGFEVPVVVKPVDEGSSVGVSVVHSAGEVETALEAAFACSKRVLIERFVAGAEVQVAILNGRSLGAIEIEPKRQFYDYKAKYEEGGAVHHLPPRISSERTDECIGLALEAYSIVECSGLARIDLIVPEKGSPVVLEVNTIPGMTELSLAPEIAAHAGIPFDELVAEVMNSATLHSQIRSRE